MPSIPHLTLAQMEHFWNTIDASDRDGCWPWMGKRDRRSYGRVTINQVGLLAHRVAYVLETGEDRPELVLHSCHNPPCCNPAHLRYGTDADNMADKVAASRQQRGETVPNAKLTAAGVRELRTLHAAGWSYADLGTRYGISPRTALDVVHGATWKHIK